MSNKYYLVTYVRTYLLTYFIMSNHSTNVHKDLISSFLVILLTNKQTDMDEYITSLAEVTTMCAAPDKKLVINGTVSQTD